MAPFASRWTLASFSPWLLAASTNTEWACCSILSTWESTLEHNHLPMEPTPRNFSNLLNHDSPSQYSSEEKWPVLTSYTPISVSLWDIQFSTELQSFWSSRNPPTIWPFSSHISRCSPARELASSSPTNVWIHRCTRQRHGNSWWINSHSAEGRFDRAHMTKIQYTAAWTRARVESHACNFTVSPQLE